MSLYDIHIYVHTTCFIILLFYLPPVAELRHGPGAWAGVSGQGQKSKRRGSWDRHRRTDGEISGFACLFRPVSCVLGCLTLLSMS